MGRTTDVHAVALADDRAEHALRNLLDAARAQDREHVLTTLGATRTRSPASVIACVQAADLAAIHERRAEITAQTGARR